MIESLLEEIPSTTISVDDRPKSLGAGKDSERSLLEALSIVQLIVGRRRISFQYSDLSDLAQGIALRLWKWRDKNREQSDSMSDEEWKSYAARTAYNEVNRHLSKSSAGITVSVEAAEKIEEPSVEGDTEIEVFSLIRSVWQEICGLSVRQRRALLLHSQELVIYFLQSGINNEELARVMGFGDTEWNDIRNRIPLSDVQIAEVTRELEETRSLPAIARSVKKARHEARKKLEGVKSK
jgi:DNA-directed RNA polymerase specialized sigma24 family protein